MTYVVLYAWHYGYYSDIIRNILIKIIFKVKYEIIQHCFVLCLIKYSIFSKYKKTSVEWLTLEIKEKPKDALEKGECKHFFHKGGKVGSSLWFDNKYLKASEI